MNTGLHRLTAAIAAFVMAAALMPVLAHEEAPVSGAPSREVVSGVCGDDLSWSLDTASGALTIEGSGAMYDYPPASANAAPWAEHAAEITSVVFSGEITRVGEGAFYGCAALASVSLPEYLEAVGESAFFGCAALGHMHFQRFVTRIESFAFYGCASLSSASFTGGAPSSFGTGVFDACAEDFAIYYPSDHAYSWAPNGEKTFCGYPLVMFVVEPIGLTGDVNCDGAVTMADLSAVSAYMLGKAQLTAEGLANADVNGDGGINAMDLPLIYKLTLYF